MTKYQKLGFAYLGNVNSSSKIAKTNKVLEIDTYCMYLAPSDLSGYNVCAKATVECKVGCLNTSGRAIMNQAYKSFMEARIKKTKFFYEDRNQFNSILFNEIKNAINRSNKKGKELSVRLNGTSDLSPVLFTVDGVNVLEKFPDIQFYDYTKILNRVKLAQKYKNYDLTFSYTGDNWDECLEALNSNVRVAVIFNVHKSKPLPATFNGFEVIDGDKYDYRPLDGKNVIVGLRWKKIRDKQVNDQIKNSKFVVQVN